MTNPRESAMAYLTRPGDGQLPLLPEVPHGQGGEYVGGQQVRIALPPRGHLDLGDGRRVGRPGEPHADVRDW